MIKKAAATIATNKDIKATYITVEIAQTKTTISKPITVIEAQKYSNRSRNNCIRKLYIIYKNLSISSL